MIELHNFESNKSMVRKIIKMKRIAKEKANLTQIPFYQRLSTIIIAYNNIMYISNNIESLL